MIEEFEKEIVQVKLTRAEVFQIMGGKILEGHKVKVGLLIE